MTCAWVGMLVVIIACWAQASRVDKAYRIAIERNQALKDRFKHDWLAHCHKDTTTATLLTGRVVNCSTAEHWHFVDVEQQSVEDVSKTMFWLGHNNMFLLYLAMAFHFVGAYFGPYKKLMCWFRALRARDVVHAKAQAYRISLTELSSLRSLFESIDAKE